MPEGALNFVDHVIEERDHKSNGEISFFVENGKQIGHRTLENFGREIGRLLQKPAPWE